MSTDLQKPGHPWLGDDDGHDCIGCGGGPWMCDRFAHAEWEDRADPVGNVIESYLDVLEAGRKGDHPSLDHLTEDQRAEARDCLRLIDATYGMSKKDGTP